MLDGLPVPLSPLLFEDILHSALCVLNDSGLYFDFRGRDGGVAADGIFTRAKLVNGVESNNVANINVTNARDSKEVAWCKDVLTAEE